MKEMKEMRDMMGNILKYEENFIKEIVLVNGDTIVVKDMYNKCDVDDLKIAFKRDKRITEVIIEHFVEYATGTKYSIDDCRCSINALEIMLCNIKQVEMVRAECPKKATVKQAVQPMKSATKEIKDVMGNIVRYEERFIKELCLANGDKFVVSSVYDKTGVDDLVRSYIQDGMLYHMIMRHFLEYSKTRTDINDKCKTSMSAIMAMLTNIDKVKLIKPSGSIANMNTTKHAHTLASTPIDCDALLEKILHVINSLVDRAKIEYDIDTLAMHYMYNMRSQAIDKDYTLSVDILSKRLIDAEFNAQDRYERTSRKVKILTLAKTEILQYGNKILTIAPHDSTYDFNINNIAIKAMRDYTEEFTDDEKAFMRKLDLSAYKA